jgi:spore coat protein U-like protein
MKLRPSLLTVLLLMASSAAPAMAGSANSNLNVSASVVPSITITLPPPAPIPVENVINQSTPATLTMPITITLPSGITGKITLGQGQNSATGSTDGQPLRRMTDGTNFLSYELYQDAGRTQIWGNTDGTSSSVTGTGSASNTNLYIKIPAGQNVPAGNYQDVVELKVTL